MIYPRDEFKGTNFAGAALRVRTITDGAYSAGSADECVTPKPVRNFNGTAEPYTDFLISAERPEEIIGGVPFIHGTTGGAAAGTASSTDVYRAFHGGRCYELAVTTLVSGFSYYPQGTIQRFTAADQRKVLSALNQILRSFRFTK